MAKCRGQVIWRQTRTVLSNQPPSPPNGGTPPPVHPPPRPSHREHKVIMRALTPNPVPLMPGGRDRHTHQHQFGNKRLHLRHTFRNLQAPRLESNLQTSNQIALGHTNPAEARAAAADPQPAAPHRTRPPPPKVRAPTGRTGPD